ncbi:MAG: hypothetical protein M3O36_13065 [Myxococcota bacterium]|nr:hypothetical protein [Myxococcota bacterium]
MTGTLPRRAFDGDSTIAVGAAADRGRHRVVPGRAHLSRNGLRGDSRPRDPTLTARSRVWLDAGRHLFGGAAYAAFSALAFEAIGNGAIATKYNLLASLVNASIVYTTRADSLAHARWGGRGVLVVDTAMTAGAVAVLVVATLGAAQWRAAR